VQAFDMRSAGLMSAFLLVVSVLALGLAARQGRQGRTL
jgi:hypothetical protein